MYFRLPNWLYRVSVIPVFLKSFIFAIKAKNHQSRKISIRMKMSKARYSSEQIGPISPPLCRQRGVLLKAKHCSTQAKRRKEGKKRILVYTDRPRDTETDRDRQTSCYVLMFRRKPLLLPTKIIKLLLSQQNVIHVKEQNFLLTFFTT